MPAPTTNQSTVVINNLTINQLVLGSGQPILMLHGWGAHIGLIQPLAERLAQLGYSVYAPDLPGFGQSSLPPAAWSVHDYVKLVIAYLDHHQIDKAFLFGHSFGGSLSLILGSEYADRFLKLTLADASGIRPPASNPIQLRLKTYRFALNTLKSVGLTAQANQLREWYTERYGSADYKAAKGVMRETFVKVVNEDLLAYAARIKLPTLLFWGDQDADTPLTQGKLLEQSIPDAGLVVLAGAGHYSYLDKLAETARVMDYFFKQP